jgi:hypothetical protein
MDRETAIDLEATITRVLSRLFDAAEALRPRLSKDEFRVLAEALTDATAELDLRILETIYRAYPDLRPEAGRPPIPQ